MRLICYQQVELCLHDIRNIRADSCAVCEDSENGPPNPFSVAHRPFTFTVNPHPIPYPTSTFLNSGGHSGVTNNSRKMPMNAASPSDVPPGSTSEQTLNVSSSSGALSDVKLTFTSRRRIIHCLPRSLLFDDQQHQQCLHLTEITPYGVIKLS